MTKFHCDWYSQAGQDKWVCEFFKFKKNGYFLDIGAFDGVGDSNTYYLQKVLEWTGINVEPSDNEYESLIRNRPNDINLKVGIWSEPKILYWNNHVLNDKGIGKLIPITSLSHILKKYNAPALIDYVSLDIEGCEVEALKGWPWETHKAILWTIEHNLYLTKDPKLKNEIYEIMNANGNIRIVENVSCQDSHWGAFEDWYVNEDYLDMHNNINLDFIRR